MELNNIYKFWKHNSLKHIKPNRGGEFPEGWDVVEFLKEIYTEEEYGKVIDVGCGYGRLCKAFNPNKYLGIDFSNDAILKAKELNPNYTFSTINNFESYPKSDTKLLYTVLLHQRDEDIEVIVETLCKSTNKIIVAEICGRSWRRPGNPPVFNREEEEYIDLFKKYGKFIEKQYNEPYAAYKDTKIKIMIFS